MKTALYIANEREKRKAYYRDTREEAAERNIRNLKTISLTAIALLLCCFVIMPVVIKEWEIRPNHLILLPALLLCFVCAAIYSRKKKKSYWVSFAMCMAFDAVVLSFSIGIDIFVPYTTQASSMSMMYIVLPTLFIIPQTYVYALLSAAEILYITAACIFENPSVAQHDIMNSAVGLVFSIAIIQIILTLRMKDYEMRLEYQHLSMTDPLSGMLNKEAFREAVSAYLNSCSEDGQYAMCIIDMDDFKHINDRYGHNTGDRMLVLAGDIIKTAFGPDDILGRFGGDEFIVFVKDRADIRSLREKSELIQERICRLARSRLSVEASCSIGFVVAGPDRQEYDTLFEYADRALYAAKGSGKKKAVMVEMKNAG